MKLFIGLGNPGEKYKNNRHNVGYMVIDAMSSKIRNGIVTKKTNCFMNESGGIVKKLVAQYHTNTSDLWAIHDDLDIPFGSYKIQKGKGPKLHNGIKSIEEKLDSNDFWRVRVGVDNRDSDDRTPGEKYVLQDFSLKEMELLKPVIKEICKKLATF